MKNTDSGKKRSPVMLFTGLLFLPSRNAALKNAHTHRIPVQRSATPCGFQRKALVSVRGV